MLGMAENYSRWRQIRISVAAAYQVLIQHCIEAFATSFYSIICSTMIFFLKFHLVSSTHITPKTRAAVWPSYTSYSLNVRKNMFKYVGTSLLT